jgi:long-chain fatty acid transport protein
MKKFTYRLSLLTLLATAGSAHAAGFMLNEQNAAQTGDFGAGGAAIAEDASTAWFNPAGLVRLDHPQIVTGGNEIVFDTRFSGQVTQNDGGFTATQNVSNISGGTSGFIPFFHFAYPINPNLVAGFSVVTPFGLATDYTTDTYIRYANTETQLKTIDLTPSIGIKLNNKLSAGFGLDIERLLATFDSYAGINPTVTPGADTLSHNVAASWAPGWHVGLLYQPTNTTRFGLTYHSEINHSATGYSLFTGALAGQSQDDPTNQYYSGNAYADVTLPASTTFSAYHDMNNRWAVMGSVVYTQWNVFNTLTLNNVVDADANGVRKIVAITVPQGFHNTWRASVGTNYKVDEQWLLRTGIGYDESPTNNTDRNLRLPDGDRYAVAFGAHYQPSKTIGLDGGWTHEFIKPVRINNTSTEDTQTVYVAGKSYSHADVFGLQLTYNIY